MNGKRGKMGFDGFGKTARLWGLMVLFTFAAVGVAPDGASAARWTLVDFGASEVATLTPYSDWDQILRHGTFTEYVDPDGNADHAGIVPTAATPNGHTAYFGIRGTTPANFQVGRKIVATFYNRSANEEGLPCRVSLTDADSPNPSDATHPWYTMYGTGDEYDLPFLISVPGHSLAEIEYYITNDQMVSAFNETASAGNHTLVNLNIPATLTNFVLTKIELSDETDLTAPGAPTGLTAAMTSTVTGGPNSVVELRWSPATDSGANAMGIDKYYIYRNGSLYDLLPEDRIEYLGSDLYWQDVFVRPGTTYQYIVTAVDKAPFGIFPTVAHPDRRVGNESAKTAVVSITTPSRSAAGLFDPHTQLTWQGAFRLPDDGGGEDWGYARRGLAHYPDGNPGYSAATELPGSLYAYNVQDEIAEISIPKPVNSSNAGDLPRATILKPLINLFPAIYGGGTTPGGEAEKFISLAYHSAANGVSGRLYYTISSFYDSPEDAQCMGWFDPALTTGQGAWHVGGVPPDNIYPGLLSTIAFPAPASWAAANTGNRSLIVGNTYISGHGVPSNGTSLFATAPWESGGLPGNGGSIGVVELLRYGASASPGRQMINFSWCEFSNGGAWISQGSAEGVAVSYRRSIGDWWYGYDNGLGNCEYNIPEPDFGSHGCGATDWKSGLIFYNPDDLAAVATGSMEAYQPQPYTGFDLAGYSIKEGGGTESGDIAFDSDNGYLYYIERNGDPGYEHGYSLMHVFKVSSAGQSTPYDFNGDGNRDVLYRHPGNGKIGVWLMNGTAETTWAYIGAHGTAWDIEGAGDFNDDGRTDLLYRHTNGNIGLWLMNGTTETSWQFVGNHTAAWDIKGVGDFNGDGRTDILYRHTNGNIGLWLMNGTTETSWQFVGNHGTAWDIKGVGDFNGDGQSDILYHHSSGNIGLWLMTGAAETTWAYVGNHGTAWDIKGVGDFNGDGQNDILYRHSSGNVGLWLMNGTTETNWRYINNHGTWDIR